MRRFLFRTFAAAVWLTIATAPHVPALAHDAGAPWKIMALGDFDYNDGLPRKIMAEIDRPKLISALSSSLAPAKCRLTNTWLDFPGHLRRTADITSPTCLTCRSRGTRATTLLTTAGTFTLGSTTPVRTFFIKTPEPPAHGVGRNAFGLVPRVLLSYSAILRAVRASNPKVIIAIAQVFPLKGERADVGQSTSAIPGWAKANSTTKSPIIVVDMYTGFDPATESGTEIHPNAAGTQFIVDRWFDALSPLIKNH